MGWSPPSRRQGGQKGGCCSDLGLAEGVVVAGPLCCRPSRRNEATATVKCKLLTFSLDETVKSGSSGTGGCGGKDAGRDAAGGEGSRETGALGAQGAQDLACGVRESL